MNLLLDTHALLWFLDESQSLSDRAREEIRSAENLVFVSFASEWEIAIKVARKKLNLPRPFEAIFPLDLRKAGLFQLPTRTQHLHQLLRLPPHHNDPFDRMIIAQAIFENLTIVTRDEAFPQYGVPTLW